MSTTNGQKKALPAIGMALYGVGGLSVTAEVVLLLLFPVLFSHIDTVVLLVCVLLGVILSVLVMPFFYALINGNTSISTGRYHLPFAVSGLAASLTFMLLYAVGGGIVAPAFGIVGLVFLHALSAQIFAYTYYAVGVRFDRSGNACKAGRIFSFVGFAAAGIGVTLLCDGTRESAVSAVALGAIVYAAATVCVYFATVRAMPKFIRLEPKHRRSLKENYRRFFSPLRSRFALMHSVSVLLVCAASAIAAAVVPVFVCLLFAGTAGGFNLFYSVLGVAAAVAGALCAHVFRREKSGAVAAVVAASVMLVLCAGVGVLLFVNVGNTVNVSAAYAAAAISGGGIGVCLGAVIAAKRVAAVKSDCTPSRFAALSHCFGALGSGAGLSVACGVYLAATHASVRAAAICGLAAAAVIALSGAIVLIIAHKST